MITGNRRRAGAQSLAQCICLVDFWPEWKIRALNEEFQLWVLASHYLPFTLHSSSNK